MFNVSMASLSGAVSVRYFCLNMVGVMSLVPDPSVSCERCVICIWLRVLSVLVLHCVSSGSRSMRCGLVSQSSLRGAV